MEYICIVRTASVVNSKPPQNRYVMISGLLLFKNTTAAVTRSGAQMSNVKSKMPSVDPCNARTYIKGRVIVNPPQPIKAKLSIRAFDDLILKKNFDAMINGTMLTMYSMKSIAPLRVLPGTMLAS